MRSTTSVPAYNGVPPSFSISGYGGALPITIQNMPEEQFGGVYGAGDGSFAMIDWAGEKSTGAVGGLTSASSSIFVTRNRAYVFAATQASHFFTIVSQAGGFPSIALNLPDIYRVSVDPGGSFDRFRAELEFRILPAPTDHRSVSKLLRRSGNMAQGCHRL